MNDRCTMQGVTTKGGVIEMSKREEGRSEDRGPKARQGTFGHDDDWK
jgi:hypothetical protein